MNELLRLRVLIVFFIAGLTLSGITAFPLETELRLLRDLFVSSESSTETGLQMWLLKIHGGLSNTNSKYPFIAYGTDWLGFAHLVIAVAFIGPLRDPVRNVWVIEFGMIACCLVIPFALVAGEFRGIPMGWRLIDCSFGVFGMIPLLYCRMLIGKIERTSVSSSQDVSSSACPVEKYSAP